MADKQHIQALKDIPVRLSAICTISLPVRKEQVARACTRYDIHSRRCFRFVSLKQAMMIYSYFRISAGFVLLALSVCPAMVSRPVNKI